MMQNLKKAEYFFLTVAASVGTLYILSHYGKAVLSVFLPFIVSAVCAHFLSPPARFLCEKLRFPKWLAHIFVVITFYAAIFTVAYILISRLLEELSGLSEYTVTLQKALPSYIDKIGNFAKERFGFPALSEENAKLLSDSFSSFLSAAAGKFASFASDLLTDIIAFIPRFFISAAVTVIATCYFSADLKKIKAFLLFQLPYRAKVFFSACRVQFFTTTSKYLSASLTLSAITFFELFAGLMLIKREYAFVLALLITVVDSLPFVGCGIVLLPWSVCEWFFGNVPDAVALAVLYVIIAVVRQIAEPKILGSFIGLHPLLTLFSIYAGAKTIGIAGVFLFPIIAITLKSLNEKGIIKLFRLPPKDTEEHLLSARTKYKRYKKDK